MDLTNLASKIATDGVEASDIKLLRQLTDQIYDSSAISRSDLLPTMFRIQGQPFFLTAYPGFKTMYEDRQHDVIFKCSRQVGKSANLSRSEVFSCVQLPNYRVLYVAPLKDQAIDYSVQYLREAVNSCAISKFLQEISEEEEIGPILQSVTRQSFANGSSIRLTYAKTSPDRARGISADQIDFDEIQDQLIDSVDVITQSRSQSSFGGRRFTGTAKTLDNTIESLWQKSSQCEWVIKCPACNFHNIPFDENALKMIRSHGPSCINCGRVVNVGLGEFVPLRPSLVGVFDGYHIPQITVPAMAHDAQKWSKIVQFAATAPMFKVYHEVLGISYSTGLRTITQADIDRNSYLPSTKELQTRLSDYAYIISGVDWGIAEATSFTVHTVIGICRDGTIHVLWAKRYVGFNPDEVLRDIAQTHRFYGAHLLAADFGMGFDKNVMLAERYGLPVVQVQYDRQNQLMHYRPLLGRPRWMVDKVTAVELLFLAIRYNKIAFPPKDEFDQYTCDLMSPYEEIEDKSGIERRSIRRNPSMPDDFCHALCFAFLLALRVTNKSMADSLPANAFGGEAVDFIPPQRDTIASADLLSLVTSG